MSIITGAAVTATSYSSILSTVTAVISTFYGYVQASQSVVPGNRIVAADWQNLYSDINHGLIHQTGASMTFPNIAAGSVLTSNFVNSLTNYASQIYTNKLSVNAGQLSSNLTTSTRTTSWGSNIVHEVQYVWASAAATESFFNQGGKLLPTIQRVVNAGTSAENIAWSNLIYNAALDITNNPGTYTYNLSNYNSTFATHSYTAGSYSVDVAYTKVNAYTITAKVTFNTHNVNGILIDALPLAGFYEYYSNDAISGGTLAPTPSVLILNSLNVGGAELFPKLSYTPFAQTSIHQFTVVNQLVSINNPGNGDCTITGFQFFPEAGSGITGSVSMTTGTVLVSSSTNVIVQVSTANAVRGTFNKSYLEVYSDSINGTIQVPMSIVVSEPAFAVNITPPVMSANVTTAAPVVQHFSFGAGLTGNIYSYSASITGGGGRFSITALSIAPEVSSGGLFGDIIAAIQNAINRRPPLPVDSNIPTQNVYDNLLYTTFTPPTSTNYGDIVGTYTATLHVTFIPYDYNQSAVTVAIPLSYTVNIANRNLGSWLSAKDNENSVAGFSYDIINGVKTLTIGFGMGQDGGPILANGGTTYATPATLGILGDANPSLGIPLFSAPQPVYTANAPKTAKTFADMIQIALDEQARAASKKYCAFLNEYGSWISPNGGAGYASTFDLSYTFNVPVGDVYFAELSAAGTSALYVNGRQYISWSDPSSTTKAAFYMNAGANTIRIVTSSAGAGGAEYSRVWKKGETENALDYVSGSTGNPDFGSIGVNITDTNGNSWWSTKKPRRFAYQYWAEVYRIPIVSNAKTTYLSGEHVVKVNDFALGKTYGSWCGQGNSEGSMFVVLDDGNGNLTISMNPWKADKSTGDIGLNRTLLYAISVPYYYSALENRLANLESPFQKFKTRFFLGFDSNGKVRTTIQAFPYVYVPPAVAGQPESQRKSIWTNLVTAAEILAVGFAVAVTVVAVSAIIAGGAVVASFVSAAGLILNVVAAVLCFTAESKISMADGSTKPISDVVVGDLVYNWNKTSINKVTYVEETLDTQFEKLYSVTADEEPFATINHPLYIDGELASVIPEKTYELYPWLGKTKLLIPDRIVSGTGKPVYNLWTTGDNTFIVNGYGTTTINGDGGWARLLVEQGIATPKRVSEVLFECATDSKEMSYGSYLCNKIFGKLDIKLVNKIAGGILNSTDDTRSRRMIKWMFKTVGKAAVYITEKKTRK